MKIDAYKTIVMEHVSYPGNIGDSCAETGRYKHLKQLLGLSSNEVNLTPFITSEGFIRHPTAPSSDGTGQSWRESHFSGDQALPLFVAAKRDNDPIANILKVRLKANWYRTGDGNLIHPGLYALLTGNRTLLTIAVVVQALIFKIPFRWSDAYKKFEDNSDSSADHLNYIHSAVYVPKLFRKLVPKQVLKDKIRNYYQVEPNVQFLIDLYDQVIDKYF